LQYCNAETAASHFDAQLEMYSGDFVTAYVTYKLYRLPTKRADYLNIGFAFACDRLGGGAGCGDVKADSSLWLDA